MLISITLPSSSLVISKTTSKLWLILGIEAGFLRLGMTTEAESLS